MKKSEFKKMMKKENKAFKNYYVYEIIIILLTMIMVVGNVFATSKNLIPNNITIINSILIMIIAIPIILIDIKNDKDIKEMYQIYNKESKISEYKDKTKSLKIVLVISIVAVLISSIITITNISVNKDPYISEIENALEITSNKGNIIKTQYEDFGGFSLKIPGEFKIMSDEMLNVKYPNGNPPSLVYTNERGTINVALVMNDVAMKNTQIEEYIKTMESTYKNYSKDIKINFWERNNHKIGEMEFTTQSSDTEIYNHMIVFSVDSKLRLVNFNCTKEFSDEWKEISKFIIESIKFE